MKLPINPVDLEDIQYAITRALGVAMLLSESPTGDKYNRAAAGAICNELQKADELIEAAMKGPAEVA